MAKNIQIIYILTSIRSIINDALVVAVQMAHALHLTTRNSVFLCEIQPCLLDSPGFTPPWLKSSYILDLTPLGVFSIEIITTFFY